MCLRFQFCTHQRVCILHFLKKSQIRCTLNSSLYTLLNTSPLTYGGGLIGPPFFQRPRSLEMLLYKKFEKLVSLFQDLNFMNLFCIFFKNTSVFYNLTLKTTFQKVGVQKVAAICEAALMCITLQNSFIHIWQPIAEFKGPLLREVQKSALSQVY